MSDIEASSSSMVEDTAVSAAQPSTEPTSGGGLPANIPVPQLPNDNTCLPILEATSSIGSQLSTTSVRDTTNISSTSLTANLSPSEVMAEINRLAGLVNSTASLAPIYQPSRALRNVQACFMCIPKEIRDLIYEYLLYNPELADIRSVSKHIGHGTRAAYGLCSQLLRVSRAIKVETFKFLYERNTFYMACLPSRDQQPYFGWFHLSPITRYHDERSPEYPSITSIFAIEQVRKWNAVVSARDTEEEIPDLPPWAFLDFCRAICGFPLKSLDVSIIRKRLERGLSDTDYLPPAVVLDPVKLLRSVEHFQILDATPFGVPDCVDQDENILVYPSQLDNLPAEVEVDLSLLVTSNAPLERGFKMYQRVLKYAQAFERNVNFKREMSIKEDEILDEEWLGKKYNFYHNNPLRNPFKGKRVHPVESALMRARVSGEMENCVDFKNERAIILGYLEDQYQRISAASNNIVDFVKAEKKYDALLDAYVKDDPMNYSEDKELTMNKIREALTLVEDYAEYFQRDMPKEMKKDVRLHASLFRSFYSGSIVEGLLGQLKVAFEIADWRSFVELFRETTSTLDESFLQMLKLRKELFQDDDLSLNEIGCDIDPELFRSAEPIDWSVNEPDYDVPEGSDDVFDNSSESDSGDPDNDGSEQDDASGEENDDSDDDDQDGSESGEGNDSENGSEDGEEDQDSQRDSLDDSINQSNSEDSSSDNGNIDEASGVAEHENIFDSSASLSGEYVESSAESFGGNNAWGQSISQDW